MKSFYRKKPFNFGGIENQSFEKAKMVIIPIPFERTARGGVEEGPRAIISASLELEEIRKISLPIFTLDEMDLSSLEE